MSNKENFSKETIEYVSKLALIDLKEEEKDKFLKQLSDIISYFKKLDLLDTKNVKPTTHPIDTLNNVYREDIPRESLSIEDTLKNAQHKKDGYFKAPRILKE